jgi:transposase-like protein
MSEPLESTSAGEMIEPMTVDIADQKELAEQLLAQAKEQNIELVGPDGLLGHLTKNVLETALDAEMSEHLDYEKHAPTGRGSGNSRNGTRARRRCSRRSLTAHGLTTGEISAHFGEVYGAKISKDTVSRITEKGHRRDEQVAEPAAGEGLPGDLHRCDGRQGP